MEPTTPDAIDPPANVLLVGAHITGGEECRELCEVDEKAAEIRISFAEERPGRPDELETEKLGYVWAPPAGTAEAEDPVFDGDFAVATIEEPYDLPALGMQTSTFCEEWGTHDVRLVVCFESLERLLKREDPETVFRFAHILTKRLEEVEAMAHFHLDPKAADQRVASTFSDIFDAVVIHDSVGEDTQDEPDATPEPDPEPAPMDDEEPVSSPAAPPDGSLPEASDEDIAAALDDDL